MLTKKKMFKHPCFLLLLPVNVYLFAISPIIKVYIYKVLITTTTKIYFILFKPKKKN